MSQNCTSRTAGYAEQLAVLGLSHCILRSPGIAWYSLVCVDLAWDPGYRALPQSAISLLQTLDSWH